MNEMRLLDPFALDPVEDAIRALWRPWRMETEAAPRIRLDVSEVDGRYAVKAEIPGARKEDIDVRIDGNQVTISAELKKAIEEREPQDKGRLLRNELRYGFTTRSFTLACPIDQAKAEAHYEDGILSLTLPKKSAETQHRLAIN